MLQNHHILQQQQLGYLNSSLSFLDSIRMIKNKTIKKMKSALTRGYIFMLIKISKWNEWTSYVPHIYAMIKQQGAVGNVISTLWAPLDASH